jgi:L-alanine-DL-glutamate epimerase-like enolase superfamily enzyme
LVKRPKTSAFPLPSFFSSGILVLKAETKEGVIGYGEPNLYFQDEDKIINFFKKYYCQFVNLDHKKLKKKLSTLSKTHLENYPLQAAFYQAMWDIEAQMESLPLHKKINIRSKNKVKVYASAGMFFEGNNPEKYVEEAIKFSEENFFGYKFRPSFNRNPKSHIQRLMSPSKIDLKILIDTCNLITLNLKNNKFKLMIDLGCRLNLEEAITFLSNIDINRFLFVEEPISRNNLKLNNKLSNKFNIKISGGENFTTFKELKSSYLKSYLQFLQPDSNLMPLDSIIDLDGMLKKKLLVLHNWFSEINCNFNVNLGSALKSCDLIEYRTIEDPFREYFFYDILRPNNGYIHCSNNSGAGIKLNIKMFNKYKSFEFVHDNN